LAFVLIVSAFGAALGSFAAIVAPFRRRSGPS
jgi:hypothetical protein